MFNIGDRVNVRFDNGDIKEGVVVKNQGGYHGVKKIHQYKVWVDIFSDNIWFCSDEDLTLLSIEDCNITRK